MLKTTSLLVALVLLLESQSFRYSSFRNTRFVGNSIIFSSANVDLFSSGPSITVPGSAEKKVEPENESNVVPASSQSKPSDLSAAYLQKDIQYKEQAARLRSEAKQMETDLRAEALARGIPEDLINQYLPQRRTEAVTPPIVEVLENSEIRKLSRSECREKLEFLEVGDALKITSALDSLKENKVIALWNSKSLEGSSFSVGNTLLKIRTSIDPISLKLDDVGYNYQNVLVTAIVLGTVLALSSSTVGGEFGFLLGYASALLPIGLVGIGSIAPSLIGDILLRSKMLVDSELKERYLRWNAAKFLVGYILGLPINRYDTGGPSNTVEFFQLRPQNSKKTTSEEKLMFAKKKFTQSDIARSSTVCLAGAVAECMKFGNACGANAADVNVLYELLQRVDPPLKSERIQDHIRWSAVSAFEILDSNKEAYERVVEAFKKGLAVEDVIAALECAE